MEDSNQRKNSRNNPTQLILIVVNILVSLCALHILSVTGIKLQIETDLLKAICAQTKEFSLSQKVQLSLQNRNKYVTTLNSVGGDCQEVTCTKKRGGKCQNVQKINCGSSIFKPEESRGNKHKEPTGIGAEPGVGVGGAEGGDDLTGYKLYSVTPRDKSQIQSLVQMGKDGVQFWREPTMEGIQSDLMLSPKEQAHYKALTRTGGMEMKEQIADVLAHIRTINVTDAICDGDITWDAFYNLKDIYTFMDKLEHAFPDNAEVITYGQSYEMRPLKLIYISESCAASASAAVKKPIVFIECNIHAREWISAAMCTFLINDLLVDKKECISTFLTDFDFYLIPVANPDGYVFSHVQTPAINRLWRKTRSSTSNPNCAGVDPNRNFDLHWMESGTSSDPCSAIYGGSKANSEVEVESIQKYLLKPDISSRLRVYLPVHSAAQALFWPWSYEVKNMSDEHYNFFWETSQNAVEAMAKRYGTQFQHGPSAEVYGPTSGSSDDWTYENILQHKTEKVYVATFELRKTPNHFVIPGSEIISQTLEAMDGMCVIIQAVGSSGGNGPVSVKPPLGKTTTTTMQPMVTPLIGKTTATTKKPETKPPAGTGTAEPDCN